MDVLSGVRTVNFKVWISYLDVHFDYPNAVARLTVDRASAYGTPTCVFQINNSIGFLVGPPNIYLNKSRSFLSWLCSTHACWAALAHANLPMKELSGVYSQYPWSCNSDPICDRDVAMWIASAYNAYISCGCFMFAKSKFTFIRTCYCPFQFFSTGLLSRQSGVLHIAIFVIEDSFDCCIPESVCQNSLICLLLRCHVAFCSGTFHISAAMERIIKNCYAIAPVTNRISFEFTRIASTFTILKYCIQII